MVTKFQRTRSSDIEFIIACTGQDGERMRDFIVNLGAIFNAL